MLRYITVDWYMSLDQRESVPRQHLVWFIFAQLTCMPIRCKPTCKTCVVIDCMYALCAGNASSNSNECQSNLARPHTPCLIKTVHLTFDQGKSRPIFKILPLSDSQANYQCNYHRVFHLTVTVLLHYLAKFKNKKLWLNFCLYHHN